jgi:hypothetical protein
MWINGFVNLYNDLKIEIKCKHQLITLVEWVYLALFTLNDWTAKLLQSINV